MIKISGIRMEVKRFHVYYDSCILSAALMYNAERSSIRCNVFSRDKSARCLPGATRIDAEVLKDYGRVTMVTVKNYISKTF